MPIPSAVAMAKPMHHFAKRGQDGWLEIWRSSHRPGNGPPRWARVTGTRGAHQVDDDLPDPRWLTRGGRPRHRSWRPPGAGRRGRLTAPHEGLVDRRACGGADQRRRRAGSAVALTRGPPVPAP